MTQGNRIERAKELLVKANTRQSKALHLATLATMRLSDAEEAVARAHIRLSKALRETEG